MSAQRAGPIAGPAAMATIADRNRRRYPTIAPDIPLDPMRTSLALGTTLLLLAIGAPAQAVLWSPANGGNGHYYEVVYVAAGVSWTQAFTAATARGGYLATPTSAAENDFVFQLVDDALYGNQEPKGSNLGPWLGGCQTSDPGTMPNANWTWVTGETWSFTSWHAGEPNNFLGAGEDYLSYKCHGSPGCRLRNWNDLPDLISVFGTPVRSYVVEYDGNPWPASCTLRNGSGVNPVACACLDLPVLGATWHIDTAPNANTVLTYVMVAFQPAATPLPFLGGEVLIDLAALPLAGFGTHAMTIPAGPMWLGFPVCAQGCRFDVVAGRAQLVMLNAIDGSFGQ